MEVFHYTSVDYFNEIASRGMKCGMRTLHPEKMKWLTPAFSKAGYRKAWWALTSPAPASWFNSGRPDTFKDLLGRIGKFRLGRSPLIFSMNIHNPIALLKINLEPEDDAWTADYALVRSFGFYSKGDYQSYDESKRRFNSISDGDCFALPEVIVFSNIPSKRVSLVKVIDPGDVSDYVRAMKQDALKHHNGFNNRPAARP